jgi:carboxypeptidase Taq
MYDLSYQAYKDKMQQVADFRYSAAVLQWDQETYMPVKGEAARARQIATLSEEAHQRFTAPDLGRLLQELAVQSGLTGQERRNVLLSLEDHERERKLSAAFVRRQSETVSKAFQSWIAARKAGDFQVLAPVLEELIGLKREEADYKGYNHHPYDALLNDYEKGATVKWLDDLFGRFIPPLRELLDKIARAPQVTNAFLTGEFPRQQQWNFGLDLLKNMGLDFDASRQDISEHPFTTSFSASDVRITTRISETDFGSMTWSCIHEGGHALYEQGLPGSGYGLPLGEPCSLSIHESQSRLWENNVGRDLPFWEGGWPLLLRYFPGPFKELTPTDFYKGINRVAPSLIRTEADELTYHFHIVIRYELEKGLLDRTLSTRDIPAYWNEAYKKYLNIDVPDDLHGCLQDVHWSHGSFGYFPTYTLGSLYAAQLFAACARDLPGMENDLLGGNNAPLLGWLRDRIHRHGRFYTSEALCAQATGSALDPAVFLSYANAKFSGIYDLQLP